MKTNISIHYIHTNPQRYRLMAESLDSIAAFIGQGMPKGHLTNMESN